MSSNRVCKKCDSNDIEVDRARGITYCTNCGNVLEESIIVSEVQIEEGAGGGCNIVGQFVGANDTRGISINGLQNSLRESKEITLQNGKRLINEMASQLRLNQHCMDTAFNFYKLAVQRGLTRGRKIRQVIAACLYLVCRTEGTPHMLLDLCDIVHDDACYISSLGKLAMKFAYLLCIKLPEIDPSLFIPRFAQKLNFGDKTHDVTLTALRLVQRMNRDWMATGRRPSGLCGAALLVSARMYEFDPKLDEIVKVVKIGKTTLRKRMLEFEDTRSSNLTVDEFHTIDLEEEHDPPAFTRSKRFAEIKKIEEMTNIEEIEKEIIVLQENIETALNELNKPRGIMAKYAKICQLETEILGPNKDLTNIDTEIKEAEEFLSEEQINIIKSIVTENPTITESVEGCSSNIDSDPSKWNNLAPTLRSIGLARDDKPLTEESADDTDLDSDDDDDLDEEDELDQEDIDDFDDENEDNNEEDDDLDLLSIRKRRRRYKKLKAKKRKLMLIQKIEEENTKKEEPVVTDIVVPTISDTDNKAPEIIQEIPITNPDTNSNLNTGTTIETSDDLDLTGIDDSEIDSMLLTKDEIKTKAKLWLRANKDWLKEQKIKEDQKQKDKEEEEKNNRTAASAGLPFLFGTNGHKSPGNYGRSLNGSSQQPKKPRTRKPKNTTPVANPQEAIERMLLEKKLSNKINYDVLKNLNKDLKKT